MGYLRLRCLTVLFLLALVSTLIGCSYFGRKDAAAKEQELLKSTSGYQAVLLTNGQVYFGKLEGIDTPHPVLRDVFYIQSAQNKDTKEVKFVLVKRGKEAHAPDRMILNPQHIVLVEPVSQDSKVAELMAESKRSGT